MLNYFVVDREKAVTAGHYCIPMLGIVTGYSMSLLKTYCRTSISFSDANSYIFEVKHARSFIGVFNRVTIEHRETTNSLYFLNKLVRKSFGEPHAFLKNNLINTNIKSTKHGHFVSDFGCFGYFGYDLFRYFRKRTDLFNKKDSIGVPDVMMYLTKALVLTYQTSIQLKSNCGLFSSQYFLNLRKLRCVVKIIYVTPSRTLIFLKRIAKKGFTTLVRTKYLGLVTKAVTYIHKGKLMQVQVSRRFVKQARFDVLQFFKSLKAINPSPYMFLLRYGFFDVLGISPEIQIKQTTQRQGYLTIIKPIAGTRPRGRTVNEDLRFEAMLRSDLKEIAEHVMLVDLARNELGIASTYDSVYCFNLMSIEKYSHVQHIVSTVKSKINRNSTMDILKIAFPAGTVTGTPKLKAMDIIDKLEPMKRSFYGGTIGYISTNDIETAITIRTSLIHKQRTYLQSAAGIVFHSKPVGEVKETENKVVAILSCINKIAGGSTIHI
ncbi:anthranilate synthase component I family protein [Candidatus Tremblaya phenacola]|uniref:anthranilate synthase component I family protein n=1 Tax=Candidatus Tremblayella phenacoccinincola TaxID=1010676 RepID=UPI00132FC95B|nr:anthranilate synthase component I family protein [Candidatus Tremblaya phenacola]KAH0998347.1 Anthranilate synthase, aminase component [Candidatus Tremblaya phenacola]